MTAPAEAERDRLLRTAAAAGGEATAHVAEPEPLAPGATVAIGGLSATDETPRPNDAGPPAPPDPRGVLGAMRRRLADPGSRPIRREVSAPPRGRLRPELLLAAQGVQYGAAPASKRGTLRAAPAGDGPETAELVTPEVGFAAITGEAASAPGGTLRAGPAPAGPELAVTSGVAPSGRTGRLRGGSSNIGTASVVPGVVPEQSHLVEAPAPPPRPPRPVFAPGTGPGALAPANAGAPPPIPPRPAKPGPPPVPPRPVLAPGALTAAKTPPAIPPRPVAAPAAPPASADKLARVRTRSRELHSQFSESVDQVRDHLAPDAAIATGAGVLDAMGESTADDLVESTVKPIVLGAAVKKLATGAKSNKKDTVGKNLYEELSHSAGTIIVEQRLAALDKFEADISNDGYSAFMAGRAPGDTSEFIGPRNQVSASDAARLMRARAALSKKAKPGQKAEVSEKAMKAAGEQLISALLDAELLRIAEAEAPLAKFYKDTKPAVKQATTAGLQGSAHLVPALTSEITNQLRDWGALMRGLMADATGRLGESDAELDAVIASMNKLAGEASALVTEVDARIPHMFEKNPALERVAVAAGSAAAGPAAAAAVEGIQKYMGKDKAVKARMTQLSTGADKHVKDELFALADKRTVTQSAAGTAAREKVDDQLKGATEGATSRLRSVGGAIDSMLANNSKAGASTFLEMVVKIPVAALPGAFLGVRMRIDANATSATVSGQPETSVGCDLGLQAGGSLPLAAEACVELGGYMRASGRSAAEAMEFMSYALYRRFRESMNVPKQVTNAIWGLGGVSQKAGQSENDAKFNEAEAWGMGMEERLSASGGSAETGAYAAARGELGVDPKTGTPLASAAAVYSTGTRYDANIIDKRRAKGAGKAVETQFGAQSSVGQFRRNISLSGSATAAGFGASGQGNLSWGLVQQPDGKTGYQFENLDIRLGGVGRKPASSPLGDDRNTTLSITNWAASLLNGIRALRAKMAAAQETTLDGSMSKTDIVKLKAKFLPIAYSVDEATGAHKAAEGWLEALRGGGGGSGGSSSGISAGAKATGTSLADDVADTGAAKSVGKLATGAVSAGKSVADALNIGSQSGVQLSGHYQLTRSGPDSYDHVLDIALGLTSQTSINIHGVRVVYSSTNNLVTIQLLPSPENYSVTHLEFAARGGVIEVQRSDEPVVTDELVVLAEPAVYRRVIESRLFGLVPQYLPERSPLVADRPVWLSLRWHGIGTAPASLDTLTGPELDEASWQLTSATQDFDGVRLGYRTVGPDDELALAVLDVLAAEGWTAYRSSRDEPIRASYAGANGELEVAVTTDEYHRFLVVLAELPVTFAPDRVAAAGELALRLSTLMDIATVDVDLDEGAVRMRSSADFDGAPIVAAIVRNTVLAAVVQGDLFLPAFAAVAAGGSPLEAVDIAVASG